MPSTPPRHFEYRQRSSTENDDGVCVTSRVPSPGSPRPERLGVSSGQSKKGDKEPNQGTDRIRSIQRGGLHYTFVDQSSGPASENGATSAFGNFIPDEGKGSKTGRGIVPSTSPRHFEYRQRSRIENDDGVCVTSRVPSPASLRPERLGSSSGQRKKGVKESNQGTQSRTLFPDEATENARRSKSDSTDKANAEILPAFHTPKRTGDATSSTNTSKRSRRTNWKALVLSWVTETRPAADTTEELVKARQIHEIRNSGTRNWV